MSDLCGAADDGDLERAQALVEQGADKNETSGLHLETPLMRSSRNGHLHVV